MADVPDEELVRRFLRGDGAALGAIVERHQARIHSLCYRMLGRHEDAADATQDVFVTCMRKLAGFRQDSKFSTWLYRVAVNTCYDVLRKRSRERPAEEEPSEEAVATGAMGDPASQASAAADVERGLRQIPEEYRVVLLLHDLHDLPYEEIAEAIGAPLGTVKSRIHRARVALARALGEPPGGPDPSKYEEAR